MPGPRPLRLLHTSDVHLGGGFRAPEDGDHLDHCLCPLVAIETAVDRHRPDAVLVVGDLFDHQRVDEALVAEVLGRLAAIDATCVVMNGNHDLHDDRSLYRTWDSNPGPVVFLDRTEGSTVDLLGGALTVWGKAMDDHHRGFRPLHDVPPHPGADRWWVVLGHGHYESGADVEPIRSSPLTPADIEATEADYLALGHWHRRTEVSAGPVTAWYSGAPYGPGASGSLNLVDLHPDHGVAIEEVPVQLPASGCRP